MNGTGNESDLIKKIKNIGKKNIRKIVPFNDQKEVDYYKGTIIKVKDLELKKFEDWIRKKKPNFCVALGGESTFTWEDNNKKINAEVNIYKDNNNFYYFSIDNESRAYMEGTIFPTLQKSSIDDIEINHPQEKDIKEFYSGNKQTLTLKDFRVLAGGALPVCILKDKNKKHKPYIIFIRRDQGAPNYPGHFTLASGLSESIEEIRNPQMLLFREFYEEIKVFSRDFTIFYNTENKNFSKININPQDIYENKFKSFKDYLKIPNNIKSKQIKSRIIEIGEDILKINGLNDSNSKKNKGHLVLDVISGALDYLGVVEFKIEKRPEDLIFIDFEEIENKDRKNRFLLREIFLIDFDNIKKMLEGEFFDVIIYSTKKNENGDIETNVIQRKEQYIRPALTPVLRDILQEVYSHYYEKYGKKFNLKPSPKGIYDMKNEYLVEDVFHNEIQYIEKEKDDNGKSQAQAFGNRSPYLGGPSTIYKVKDWKYNLGEAWKKQFITMFTNEPKEFRKIIERILNIIDELDVQDFTALPYFTEHYKTHSRNVAKMAFEIMLLNNIEFNEKDYLLIGLAALIHDLGQYTPEASQDEIIRDETEELFEKFYIKLIKRYNDTFKEDEILKYAFYNGNKSWEIKKISELTKFGQALYLIAIYHPKDMPLDNLYKLIRFFQICSQLEIKNQGTNFQEICKIFKDIILKILNNSNDNLIFKLTNVFKENDNLNEKCNIIINGLNNIFKKNNEQNIQEEVKKEIQKISKGLQSEILNNQIEDIKKKLYMVYEDNKNNFIKRFKNTVSNENFEDRIKNIFEQNNEQNIQEKIEHYKKLAAILQIADAVDINKFRNVSLQNIFLKIDYIFSHLNNAEKIKKTIDSLVKDLLIENVEIEKSRGNQNNFYIKFIISKDLVIKPKNSKNGSFSHIYDIKEDKWSLEDIDFEFNKNEDNDLKKLIKKVDETLDNYNNRNLTQNKKNAINYVINKLTNGNSNNPSKDFKIFNNDILNKYFRELFNDEVLDQTKLEIELVYPELKSLGLMGIKLCVPPKK